MGRTRRHALFMLVASSAVGAQQQYPPDQEPRSNPFPKNRDEDTKLPNGKSQTNEIAKQNHERSLKEANELVDLATSLRDELQKAGNYVVPLASVRKTEDIEKLARRIRGRLKA